MTPELNTIIQGDCVEVMRSWPDSYADYAPEAYKQAIAAIAKAEGK